MARVLITAPPFTGHLNPALAVAKALAAQGHDIAWAVHAEQVQAQLPHDAHVFPLEIGDGHDGAIPVTRERGLESVHLYYERLALPMAQRMLAPMEAAVHAFQPDIVIVDHQMLGGALVARKLGLRWASLVTTTASILKLSQELGVLDNYLSLQKRYLPEDQWVERPDFSPHAVIVFSIEALLGNPQLRVAAPYHFVGAAQATQRAAIEFPWSWLRPDHRKLLVSLGTVSRDRDTRFFEVMLEAVADIPQLQVVMVAPETLAAQAPANVLVRPFVPQLELLPHMDGVICHAGHNTVCETLSQGLPLIVAPIRDDQPVIARQVIDAGAALFMRHGKVTVNTAKTTIERLLSDDNLRANAQRLAQEFRQAPGVDGAARLIAQLAA